MTVQDDINAAVVNWAAAVNAYKAQVAAVAPLNVTVQANFAAVKLAFGQVLAGQTVDVLALATALKAAFDAYTASQAVIPALQQGVTDASTALATLLAPAIGGDVGRIMQVLTMGTQQ